LVHFHVRRAAQALPEYADTTLRAQLSIAERKIKELQPSLRFPLFSVRFLPLSLVLYGRRRILLRRVQTYDLQEPGLEGSDRNDEAKKGDERRRSKKGRVRRGTKV
jgi:hypothetical protein